MLTQWLQRSVLSFIEQPIVLSNADGCWLESPSWQGVLGFHTWCNCIFQSVQEYTQRLENELQSSDKTNLQLQPGKCVFAQTQVNYLVFLLSEKGVSASSDKIKAVRNYPTPKNVEDFRANLSLASFFRRLVQEFAGVVKPLTELTKKDWPFIWRQSQQKALKI